MSFNAKLSVSGKDFDVLSCNYNFSQGTGKDGRPTSDVRGGQISLAILSSDDTTLAEWMVNPTKTLDGEISFYKPDDSEQVMKKIKFTKAYCVSHSESFSSNGNMMESIVLSAQKITVGNAEHENKWSK